MALRLIEIVLQKKHLENVRNFLESHDIIEHRELKLQNDKMLVRILLEAEQSGPILHFFCQHYANNTNRLVVMPVEATLPRAGLDADNPETIKTQKGDRISSDELYEDIKSSAKYSRTYVAMLLLSIIVAAVGLHNNSVISIIGAMVIAPMLGPLLAISLGIVLGESQLLLKALLAGAIGIIIVVVLTVIIGNLINLDPSTPEIAVRTKMHKGDLGVALASGAAGALAFATGVSETIIGVMVAVSLLPPLTTFGMLLGAGYSYLAVGALELFIMNLASVNFASILVFLLKGITPIAFHKKSSYFKYMYVLIISSWLLVLLLMLGFFRLTFL